MGWGHPERNHGLSEPCLSKLQESRKLMLFDVLTMMEGRWGGSVSVLVRSPAWIWVHCAWMHAWEDLRSVSARARARAREHIDEWKRKED